MARSKLIRLVFSILLLSIGITLILIGLYNKLLFHQDTIFNNFIIYLGSASIVTGILNLFREIFTLALETEDIGN